MSADTSGLFGDPVLDGVALTGGGVDGSDIKRRAMTSQVPLATGDVRQGLAFAGATFPLVKDKYDVVLRYKHLGSFYEVIEDLMAGPGPHSLSAWKRAAYQFPGNGVRVEFDLPRYSAVDFYTPPTVRPSSAYATKVRVGVTGTPLDVLIKSSVDYAGGDPGTGEAWALEAGRKFKLGDIPADGSRIFVSHCPLLSMWAAADSARKYTSSAPLLEPRDIELTEA